MRWNSRAVSAAAILMLSGAGAAAQGQPATQNPAQPAQPAQAQPAPAQAPAAPPQPAIELKPGDAAPAFSMPGSDGKTHSLAEHAGKEAVVLAWFPKAFTGG